MWERFSDMHFPEKSTTNQSFHSILLKPSGMKCSWSMRLTVPERKINFERGDVEQDITKMPLRSLSMTHGWMETGCVERWLFPCHQTVFMFNLHKISHFENHLWNSKCFPCIVGIIFGLCVFCAMFCCNALCPMAIVSFCISHSTCFMPCIPFCLCTHFVCSITWKFFDAKKGLLNHGRPCIFLCWHSNILLHSSLMVLCLIDAKQFLALTSLAY